MDIERKRVEDDLRGVIVGDVFCDELSVQLYASDASIYQVPPLGVVRPRSAEDVVACVQYANDHQLTIHARGAGSGVAGDILAADLVIASRTPPSAEFIDEARRLGLQTSARWSLASVLVADDATALAVVLTELVTNAVRHARSTSTLRLHLHDGVLRVEVADDAAALPLPSDPAPSEPTGRGLLLVGSLSTAWGIDPIPSGKVTWANLPAP